MRSVFLIPILTRKTSPLRQARALDAEAAVAAERRRAGDEVVGL